MSRINNPNGLTTRHTSRLRLLAASCAAIALAGGAQAALAEEAAEAARSATGSDSDSGAIVVTALRREQSINEVPISVATYDKRLMDQQGIRSIDDLSRMTPALNFAPSSGVSANNGSNISIRGMASDVGSATTAIYIDDTPIQIRNVGYYGGNPYPKVFDLDRVEVLYGPQGTLFGASAEGGAVRFITPGPNYDKLSIYSRSQVSFTEEGAPSYEAGLAFGAPITDNLAFRVSGWYQYSGGYIDQVAQGTDTVIKKDVNSGNSTVIRASLGWKPTDTLTITPSFYYQHVEANARDDYWEGYGLAKDNDYHTGVYSLEPSNDTFYLPSLKVDWNIAPNIELISNTSYFARKQEQTLNYATYFSVLRTGNPFGVYSNKDLDNTNDYLTMKQKNFVQEARLQSYDNKLIDWTAGVYYAHTKQDFSNYTGSGRIPGTLINGYQQYDGRFSYVNLVHAKDEQIAGYGSVDVKPMENLTLTAAIRYSHVAFDFVNVGDGTTTGNVRTVTTANMKEGAWTPKFGISYKIAPNNMVYASATKGFRPGGAQARILSDLCTGDLATLGLTESPTAYTSDSLWSYEAGTKNSLFGGKVNFGASVYLMKWKNIQQSVRLPTCSFSFIYNLGNATGKGGELSLDVKPVEGLTLGGNVAYVDLTYDHDVFGGNGLMLKADGQHIGGPSWTGHLYGTYEREVGQGVDAYLRSDFTFASHTYQTSVSGAYGYDSGLTELDARNYLSARAGARFSGVDLSVFVENLLNSSDVLSRGHDSIGSSLYYNQSYRPRTVGMTLQYRY
ncbi:TonB-dependent receptor [Novosphingobium aerophilum]|uniref:TonB-dependent receptor n=1 Tax=Novosphingobium TaxID=165696 RepID=UPI001851B7F2|nr:MULTISPECIES: TonB-dependent receptor [unclassified Novosphingobium]WRT95348.1 TonB-dependent receptor [Novosphingobium sp. RL4]